MDIESMLNSIIDYQNYYKDKMIYDFLPVYINKYMDTNQYLPLINLCVYYDENDEWTTRYCHCWFLPKIRYHHFFILNKSGFSKNTDLTAEYLWLSHKEIKNYVLIWLYALCNQILRNKESYNDCDDIIKILEEINVDVINYAKLKDIKLPDYQRRGDVLPHKISLQNMKLNSSDRLVDIFSYFFSTEIDYIMRHYYICPIEDMRIRDMDDKIKEMIKDFSL